MKLISTGLLNYLKLFLIMTGLAACTSQPEVKTDDGRTLMQNLPAGYDPSRIDPQAPVQGVYLEATGNTMAEMTFSPDTISLPAGCTVKLIFKNNSTDMAMQHNVVVVDPASVQQVADAGLQAGKGKNFVPDMPEVYVATRMTGPGESDTLIFPVPPAGTYKFICTYPGHYSRMQGWLLVN